jgi:hypothetical protein
MTIRKLAARPTLSTEDEKHCEASDIGIEKPESLRDRCRCTLGELHHQITTRPE